MFNILPLILIFLSLAVIIFIIGRKIPQLRELGKQKNRIRQSNALGRGKTGGIFSAFFAAIGKFFVLMAEWLVKKLKKMLHLIHFWLIKLRKGKQSDSMQREMEAKQELIKEEEKNLERVINDNLAGVEEPEVISMVEPVAFEPEVETPRQRRTTVANPEPEVQSEMNATEPEIAIFQDEDSQDEKLKEYFSDDSGALTPEKAKGSFFTRFWKKKNWIDAETPVEGELDMENAEQVEDELVVSDGVRKIEPDEYLEEFAGAETVESRRMSEMKAIRKKGEVQDLDEQLGVDRQILEKKIIQKIANNPRDMENYRNLGDLYIKMKNFVDAEESYKQVLKLAPRDMDAKRKLEKIKLLKRLQ